MQTIKTLSIEDLNKLLDIAIEIQLISENRFIYGIKQNNLSKNTISKILESFKQYTQATDLVNFLVNLLDSKI